MATKKPQSKAVVSWADELGKYADEAAGMEVNTGGGQFFSLKSGVLSWQDNPLQNNQMAVVILDSIMENVFYDGEYDPDNPLGPSCFAFGRDERAMAPHPLVTEAKNQKCGPSGLCEGCPMNAWGTADKGKGKACRNTRRLAMIPAGNFNQATGKFELIKDEDHFSLTTIGLMKLPVTSVKGYASFVKQVAGTLRRPPFGIATKVRVIPDAKTQFKVLFEPLINLPDTLMTVIMKRHEEAKTMIDFPYQPNDEEESGAKQNNQTTRNRGKGSNNKSKRKY